MKIPFGKHRALHIAEIGVCGIRLNEHWYADVFWRWPGGQRFTDRFRLGVFVHDGIFRRWYTLSWGGWELNKVEVLDAENASRIFRREMKPYAVLRDRTNGDEALALSYPCPNADNTCTIMVRLDPDDPGTLVERDCDEFEFHSWSGRSGVPANNPLPRRVS